MSNFSKLIVVSHSRCGSNFILDNLKEVLPKTFSLSKNPGKVSLEQGTLNVAVIRNPIDALLSSYAHGSHFDNLRGIKTLVDMPTETVLKLLEWQVARYCKISNSLIEHKDIIEFYSFNDIDKVPKECYKKITGEELKNTLLPAKEKNNFLPSSKGIYFYKYLKDLNIDNKIFDPAMDHYNKLIGLAKFL